MESSILVGRTEHCFSERNINFLQKLSRKTIVGGADACIASSSKSKEAQISYGAKEHRIFLSSLTVDIDRYLYQKEQYGNTILFVGQLIKSKGLDILFEAIKPIRDEDYRLEIVGSGPEKSALESMAKSYGISDRVSFAGFHEGKELEEYYQHAGIFILPTREDCFGLVLLEAMCNSLPILASSHAGAAYDLIADGENGYIFNPDRIDELTNLLVKLLHNEALRKSLGHNSYRKAKTFSFENTSKGFLAAIKSCLHISHFEEVDRML